MYITYRFIYDIHINIYISYIQILTNISYICIYVYLHALLRDIGAVSNAEELEFRHIARDRDHALVGDEVAEAEVQALYMSHELCI